MLLWQKPEFVDLRLGL
ncbi:pyrroloquinoline quinone precursor peptide PqqA, partial [Serratia marcescens]